MDNKCMNGQERGFVGVEDGADQRFKLGAARKATDRYGGAVERRGESWPAVASPGQWWHTQATSSQLLAYRGLPWPGCGGRWLGYWLATGRRGTDRGSSRSAMVTWYDVGVAQSGAHRGLPWLDEDEAEQRGVEEAQHGRRDGARMRLGAAESA